MTGGTSLSAAEQDAFAEALVRTVEMIHKANQVNITRMSSYSARRKLLQTTNCLVEYSVTQQVDSTESGAAESVGESLTTQLLEAFAATSSSTAFDTAFSEAIEDSGTSSTMQLNPSATSTEMTENPFVIDYLKIMSFNPTLLPTPVPTVPPTLLPTAVLGVFSAAAVEVKSRRAYLLVYCCP